MTRVLSLLAVGMMASLAVGTSAASALDLTGTWEGRQTCKGIELGEKHSYSCCAAIAITQSGDTANIRLVQTGGLYFGRVTAFNKSPNNRGTLTFAACGTDSTLPPDSEMVFANVSDDPKPGSAKGTLLGSLPLS